MGFVSKRNIRDVGRKVIWTIVLLGIAISIGRCYVLRKKIIASAVLPVTTRGATALHPRLNIPFPIDSSGEMEVGGMKLRMQRCNDQNATELARRRTADAVKDGWTRIEPSQDLPSDLKEKNTVCLSKGNETRVLFVSRGPEGGKMLVDCRLPASLSGKWAENPLKSNIDMPGRDFVNIPRPKGSIRTYSILYKNGSGIVTYQSKKELRVCLAEHSLLMKRSGWSVLGGLDEVGVQWYQQNRESCCVFSNISELDNQTYITVVYYGAG